MRDVPVPDKPFFERDSDQDLKDLESLPVQGGDPDRQARIDERIKRTKLTNKIIQLLAEEKVAGVIVPSRDGGNGGGTGIIFDDNGAALGRTPYHRDTAVPFPVVVAQIESYGRVFRLLENHVPVSIEMNVETKVHRRPRAWLRHGCRNSRNRSPVEGRDRHGRRPPG